MSFHDQLTGLYNRNFLRKVMEKINTKRQLPLTVIMADLKSCNKKAMSKNEIIAEFRRCSGAQFDPELVEIFLSILEADG